MSELQEVEIIINRDGNVEAKVYGIKGEKCLDVTKELFQLLGGEIINQELTDEYYQQEQNSEQWDYQKGF